MMKSIIFFIALLPILSFAGTLQDFFKQNPDLDNNIAVHTAISKASMFEAAGFARREGGDEDDLMKIKGDQFAILGFRRVKNACLYPESAAVLSLTPGDCQLVSSKSI
jgi:hypothetical protein